MNQLVATVNMCTTLSEPFISTYLSTPPTDIHAAGVWPLLSNLEDPEHQWLVAGQLL